MRSIICILAFLALPSIGSSQGRGPWTDLGSQVPEKLAGERRIVPKLAHYARLDVEAMRTFLATVPVGTLADVAASSHTIELPTPDGGVASFRFLEVPVMHPDLQARFPETRTYTGIGVEDPATHVKLDLTPHGFHAMVVPGDRRAWFIDPLVVGNTSLHQIYKRSDFVKEPSVGFMGCTYDQVNDVPREEERTRGWIQQMGLERVGDCQLRTYRLALACTGEYATFHGGTVSLVNGAMVTTMNRVNGMFQRDATLTMVMVANNNNLIYLNASTDPYTNNDGGTMLGQNQTTCDAVIGTANYDIGHVFSTGGGGVAYLNSPCNSGSKAGGVTGRSSPVGDAFDIDYVAHEMGHQFGGNHTQNNDCNRALSASVEVGSGVTIMGYAGICAPNPLNNSLAMFGAYSMQEIAANITTGTSSSCPATNSSANVSPIASAGVGRVIPRSTPFVLFGSGTDANSSNVLTYSWEQMDNAVATQPPLSTNTGGPAWIPLLPTTSPVRYMPNLAAVLANTSPTWEVLSSVGRTYTFRLTVRDNVVGRGCNGQSNMVVTVNAASGPFLVTQPNTAVSWAALSAQTVTWNVANTTASPVSCPNVNILLSTDGGQTFPVTLAANTPNDGTQSITLPNSPTSTARIKVECSSNIFYDLSNTNFTITAASTPDYTLSVTSNTAMACQPGNATYTVQVGSLVGYNDPVTLSASGLPAGPLATFNPNPRTPGGSSTLTISNTSSVSPGTYPFTLNATSTSGPKSLSLTLVVTAAPGQVVLLTPANGAAGVTGAQPLTWNADPAAVSYSIQIASDPGMTNILESGTGITSLSYQPGAANQPNTTYYWVVQSVNPCGFGTPSATWSYTMADCQNMTIKITLDRYGAETTWSLRDGIGTIYASGGPYTTVATNGAYPQQDVNVCLPPGCYDLTVNDSAGDGLCCAFGSGSITVQDGNGIPLAQASVFTSQSITSFCLPNACISTLPITENFTTSTGQWYQGQGDDIDWTRISGSTVSSNTGPTGDHTTGTGFYMYTEASSPNFPNKLATLYGPCVDLTGLSTAQLTFWYHMFGVDMGVLAVDVWNGSAWTLNAFTLTGAQGNLWQQATVSLDAFVGGTARIRFRGTTGAGFTSDMAIDDISIDGANVVEVQLGLKAWLEGPYRTATTLMHDSLRVNNLIPLLEPYTALGFTHVGGGGETTSAPVLATAGVNAIVDWVLVELRSATNNTTIVATRSALLQRDGDVVDIDGISPVSFPVATGSYYIALKHRNHFGCMTASTVALNATSVMVDLRTSGTVTYGTDARKDVSGALVLWAGNAFVDGQLKYTGEVNDRDVILGDIGGSVPTNSVSGYMQSDVNMDGRAKYTGDENDRDVILLNIGGVVPTNVRYQQMP